MAKCIGENKSCEFIGNQIVYFKSSESMDELQDGSIDVIITSPPYNRGKNYSSDDKNIYNDKKPEQEYLDFLKSIWKECLRVASESAILFLNIGDSARDQGISEKVAISAEDAGWIRIQDIVWVKSIYGKGHYTPSGRSKRFNNVWEHIYMFAKDKAKYKLDTKAMGIPYADKSNIGRYGDSDLRDPGNIFHICYEKTTGASVKKGHDAPFPIGLPYACIKSVPNAKFILDPFLGTGTTLAAANVLNLKGIGYEKYPRIDLIKSTIESGLKYEQKQPILIPHYESSIKTLLDIFGIDNEITITNLKSPKLKKEVLRWEILIDTLEKMNVNDIIIKELKNKLVGSKE